MPTASKKEIVLSVANKTNRPSAEASAVCQSFLDQIVEELAMDRFYSIREEEPTVTAVDLRSLDLSREGSLHAGHHHGAPAGARAGAGPRAGAGRAGRR